MESSSSFLMLGLVYAALGIPLYFRKVKRNGLYGFRIEKTLSDDKYWYPTNEIAGKWFVISGIFIAFLSIVLNFIISDQEKLFWTMITLVILGAIVPAIVAYKHLRTIP